MRFPARTLILALALVASVGRAQVELVDPDTADSPRPDPTAPTDESTGPVDDDEQPAVKVQPTAPVRDRAPRQPRDAGSPGVLRGVAAQPAVPPPPEYLVRQLTDADLEQVWQRWKKVETGNDFKAEQAARAELLSAMRSVGATAMDSWAMGLLRLSSAHAARGDSGAAVEIAITAPQLSPSLPSAWVGLSRAYFQADPSGLGRTQAAMATAIALQASDPRFSRAVVADVAATALLALVLTALAVIGVLFLRWARLFFFDFHFFFPRVVARWQTTALAMLLLSLPLVFRLGLVPVLLALFAATTLYLTTRERIVAAGLLAVLGLVPTVAGLVVDHTAFAGTPADELFTIERGGPGIEGLVKKYEALALEDKVGFAERYVLGHHHLRRGRLDQAAGHFRRALAINPEHLGTTVNLGVLFFLQGDLENSRSVLEGVTKTTRSAAAFYNLGRVYQRRVQVYGDSAAGEVGRALDAFSQAAQLDPSLPTVVFDQKPPAQVFANELVRTVGLEPSLLEAYARAGDAGERVRSQLTLMLLGDLPAGVAPFFPGLMALLVVGLGSLNRGVAAARECNRCGKPVSVRSDPEVSAGSLLCTQCVNAFAKKNVVAPSLKVRKQLEVARYQNRLERTGLVLAALWSGMGHVFAGLPVRGAVFGFFFIAAVAGTFMRTGLLRTQYEAIPSVIKLAPLVALALILYVTSLRSLRRKRG